MMPFAKNEKKPPKGSRQNIFGVSGTLSTATTWRRNGTPTKPEQTTGAIWPGPCGSARKGNHGLKSPRRLGAANGLPVRW
jgi:hypothetical protein